MMKKSILLKVLSLAVFIFSSAIFINNGNVYAQNLTDTSNRSQLQLQSGAANSNDTNPTGSEETVMLSTISQDGNTNSTNATDTDHKESETPKSVITRDSQTVLLEDVSLPANSFLHLYDSTPYQINNGHVAAKVPCGDDNQTSINILLGKAPNLKPAELEYIGPLSEPGNLCLYHADVSSSKNNPMTDIAIQNNSTEDIDFPATSTVVLGVNEISLLENIGHEE